MKITSLVLSFCLLLFACTDEIATDTPEASSSAEVIQEISKKTEPTKLVVGLEHLRLRATPGSKGEELAHLDKGTVLLETGEVSDFTTRIKLRGIWFDEPWIKVRTPDGTEGWVYAGAVVFRMEQSTALSEKLLDIRLKSFFGDALTADIHAYRKSFHSTKTSQDFAMIYEQGKQLQERMVKVLEDKINVPELDYEQLPDLFWVEESLPGYETALVAEGTIYYLFRNFKTFRKIAAKTTGKEDDDFIELNLKVHATDSVEYFFPAWYLQTWDYGGHSLLGQGIHLDVLKEADQVLKKSDLFLDDVLEVKNRLLDDITGEQITYWESLDKIKKELDGIITAELSILTNEDKVALETRRAMFNDPKANKIEVNQRSGN